MNDQLIIYLIIHGITTVGSTVVFLIRNEHRITRLETKLENLEEQHNIITRQGTTQHKTEV